MTIHLQLCDRCETQMTVCAGASVGACDVDISRDEAEVYDRQIRLWGLEAQNKLRRSSVLVYGVCGLGAEVIKNLMLSGLKSMTLMDSKVVTEDDRHSNFLLPSDDSVLGTNRAVSSCAKASSLNPMVPIIANGRNIDDLTIEEVSEFTLFILLDQQYSVVEKWDQLCRKNNIRFVAGSVFGWMGYSFFDFNGQKFSIQKIKVSLEAIHGESPHTDGDIVIRDVSTTIDDEEDKFEEKNVAYPSFTEAFNVPWNSKKWLRKSRRLVPSSYIPLRAMLRAQQTAVLIGEEEKDLEVFSSTWKSEAGNTNLTAETLPIQPDQFDYFFGPQLSATCSVVGGMIGQEAIKTLSESKSPLQNIFVYSALEPTGFMLQYPPV